MDARSLIRSRLRLLTTQLATLISLGVLGWSLSVSCCEARPPNIVLILADDLGYGDLGCYGNSSRTPHIDELARQGMRFTDFHSNGAMCTSTRAALLTGLYQQRFGTDFEGPLSGKTQRHKGLPLNATTIAESLRSLGYATAMYGKWHLGYRVPFLPTRQGFDHFVGLTSGDGDHHSHIDRSGNEDWWHNETLRPETGYTADLITKHSCLFIERNRQRPFFLYVPHLGIHFPWQGPNDPPHRTRGKDYEDDKWGLLDDPKNVSPHVRSMISSIDTSLGKIIDTLRQTGVEDNTLVLFMSDNGGYLRYGSTHDNISSNGGLRGQKGDLFEGGHRVPAIAYWPGRIQPTECHDVIMSFDVFPTLRELAGGEKAAKLDGRSFAPLLSGAASPKSRTLFWRANGSFAVRQEQWKLVAYRDRDPLLFDLKVDTSEESDLSDRHPEIVHRLTEAYFAWTADVDAIDP